MVDTDLRNGKKITRNCKMCHKMGKKDAKAVNMCQKCDMPLHSRFFMAWHMPTAPRPK